MTDKTISYYLVNKKMVEVWMGLNSGLDERQQDEVGLSVDGVLSTVVKFRLWLASLTSQSS